MTLIACNKVTVSTLDYYFPLHEIEKFMVYEYEKELQHGEQNEVSTFYYKINRNSDKTFSQVYLDQEFYPSDSIVLYLTDNELRIKSVYFATNTGYDRSNETDQLFYPLEMKKGDTFTTKFTHDKLEGLLHHAITINNLARLTNIDSKVISIALESEMKFSAEKEPDSFTITEISTIKYEVGKGLTERISTRKGSKEIVILQKVWTEENWKEETAANK